MVLESACVPIPSEVTMLFAGALVTASVLAPDQQLAFWPVVLVGTAGNLVGSWIAYGAGSLGGRPLLDRWGRYLLIRPHEIDRAHDWFERYGELTVFVGRLLPVVRTFISLPAGVVRMNLWKFTLYTVLGCLPWCLLLTWIGSLLGSRWAEVEHVVRPFSWAIAVAIVLTVGWFVRGRIRAIRRDDAARAAAATSARDQDPPLPSPGLEPTRRSDAPR
jgi:membrane protein DedA with SNARE-associated domain